MKPVTIDNRSLEKQSQIGLWRDPVKCIEMGLSKWYTSDHVWMWELDYKESWGLKNWCFWTVVLKKTPESPLNCKEIQPVHPKGNQSWIFIGRTDAEAETLIIWTPDAKNWLIGKTKDWRQEEKGMTEDEMVGWHHRLDRHESEQTLGVDDGLGRLMCYIVHEVAKSWIQMNNWTELNWKLPYIIQLIGAI